MQINKPILLLLLVFTYSCSNSLKYLNSFDGLNGKPKRAELAGFKIEYKDSLPFEKATSKYILSYDLKGRKLNTTTYSFKDNSYSKSISFNYFYNKHGNETKVIMYDRDGTINIEKKTKYDRHGRIIKSVSIRNNKRSSVTKRTYNRKHKTGKLIQERDNSNLKEITVQKYDENWQAIELKSLDGLGRQKGRVEFRYDKKNNKISQKWYNSKNELYNFSKTSFNENNDPILSFSYSVKGKDTMLKKTMKFKYLYDKQNNVIEEKLFSNDKLTSITRYKYTY